MEDGREPWSRTARETLVDNPWHRYCRDSYVCPDGSDGTYFYVDMPGSCGTIPLFEDGTTVLVRVYRYLLGTYLWEFPIGGMLPDDSPLEVAQKELLEEAGLVAGTWDLLGKFAPYKGVSNEVCYFFLARDLAWEEQELESTEEITVHRMTMEEAKKRLMEQELGDGQSLSGLLYFEKFLRENKCEELGRGG